MGVAIGAIGTFTTRLLKPSWCAEINPLQQKMWDEFTQTACLGDFFELDPRMLPWVFLLVITLPCTNFSTAGKGRGDFGDTGWMFVEAVGCWRCQNDLLWWRLKRQMESWRHTTVEN